VLAMLGKLYKVTTRYRPSLINLRIEESVKLVMQIHLLEGPGDILVFLTGSEECEIAKNLCMEKL